MHEAHITEKIIIYVFSTTAIIHLPALLNGGGDDDGSDEYTYHQLRVVTM